MMMPTMPDAQSSFRPEGRQDGLRLEPVLPLTTYPREYDVLGDLQRKFPLSEVALKLADYQPIFEDVAFINRGGQLQEVIHVGGNERDIRQFFVPGGVADAIIQGEPGPGSRVFLMGDSFYTMPAHEMDRVLDLADSNNILIEVAYSGTQVRDIYCRNEGLEGECHPITGVPFKRKTVEVNGESVEGVFPQFDVVHAVELLPGLHEASNKDQFAYANEQLKVAVESDPELKVQFSEEQLEQIANSDRPDGYVWHHSENPGELQLVNKVTHDSTGHTGGQVVWGGGAENR